MYVRDAIFQLDRYHIYQEILRKISDCDAQRKGILYKNMGVQESQNCTNERNCRDIKCSNKRIQENIPRRVYKIIR